MPTAYSLDIRQKILDAFETGEYTAEEIAEIFKVHRSYPYKLQKQLYETKTLSPLPHGGGQESKLKTEHLEMVKEISKEHPDATLEQLCEQIKNKTGIIISAPTMSRTLKKLKLSLKKRPGERQKRTQSSEKNSNSSRQR